LTGKARREWNGWGGNAPARPGCGFDTACSAPGHRVFRPAAEGGICRTEASTFGGATLSVTVWTDMAKIFISYRRADSVDATGRMFDRLVAVFGQGNVFKDVDSIPLGSDFADVIAERLNECDVVIVVIGRFWLTVRGEDGKPRLNDPGDYVRIEIEQALNSRALVVPALVGNLDMPREAQLPKSIQRLARKHAISVRPDPDFHRDMDRLIRGLQEHLDRKSSPDAQPIFLTPMDLVEPPPVEKAEKPKRVVKKGGQTADPSKPEPSPRQKPDKVVKGRWSFLRRPYFIVLLLVLTGIFIQEICTYFLFYKPITSNGEEERNLTTYSWEVVDIEGVRSRWFDSTFTRGSVWTFYSNGGMKAGGLAVGGWRYKSRTLLSSPESYTWSIHDKRLILKEKNGSGYEFQLKRLDESQMRLELSTNTSSYVELKSMPRVSPREERFPLYALWLPILPAAFLAHVISCKAHYSKKRAFFKCLLVTVGLGTAGGAFLGGLQDAIHGSEWLGPAHFVLFGIFQTVVCLIVGIINGSICVRRLRTSPST
jgi:hypothetical protein